MGYRNGIFIKMNKKLENKKGFIKRDDRGKSDYESLFAEGINLLQDFSSEKWTDYNEHDPGVTILENIIYALTETKNKTTLPVKDLLLQNEDQVLSPGDNAFYLAPDILSTNPITINDYRKLIIDGVPNVKNVYFESEGKKIYGENDSYLDGLYKIYIELFSYKSALEDQQEEEKMIRKEVKKLYASFRNLCEDVYDIHIYKPLMLNLKFNIQVAPNGERVESIMTRVLTTINQYLSPDNKFYTASELQNNQVPIFEIFNGPQLKNGYIRDCDLNEKLQVIEFADITKRLAKISQIRGITTLKLEIVDENHRPTNSATEDSILVPYGYVPYLLFPKDNMEIKFQVGEVQVTPNLTIVNDMVAYLKASDFSKDKSAYSGEDFGIPKGTFNDISFYTSVREQFPYLYGIGSQGLSSSSESIRLAQANQLKAYLLPFDQLMTNFLAQLHNLYTLYDTKSDNRNSYFYQVLSDMQQVSNLIDAPGEKNDKLEQWKLILESLNEEEDSNAIIRLNQVANNLLSRFGERFDGYVNQKIETSYSGMEGNVNNSDNIILANKHKLINEYDKLSAYRTTAINYLEPIKTNYNERHAEIKIHIPALVKKLSILLNIEDYSIRLLSKVIPDSGIGIYYRKENIEGISEKLQSLFSDQPDEWLIGTSPILFEQDAINISDSFFYLGNEYAILKDVLREGILPENYSVSYSKFGKNDQYYILFNNKGKVSVVHVTETEWNAKKTIEKVINFLKKLNAKCEGVFLLEHLLLAPEYTGKNFGFRINLTQFYNSIDPNFNISLIEAKPNNLNERNNITDIILLNCTLNSSEIPTREKWRLYISGTEGEYRLNVENSKGKLIAISEQLFDDKKVLENWILIMQNNPGSTYKMKPEDLKYFAYFGFEKVDEIFFSFKMSFFLPDWPGRFQDPFFRKLFENNVYEQAPIHIVSNTFWLNFKEMKIFEELYIRLFSLLPGVDEINEINTTKFALICFIQDMQKKYNI